MDMIDNDERLLQQLFSEAANQKIEDNGFSDRVMQRLGSANVQHSTCDIRCFSRLWTWFCVFVFVVLFVLFHGWELLAVQLEVLLRTAATQTFSVNLMMLFTIIFGLLFVGVGEVISSETVRR